MKFPHKLGPTTFYTEEITDFICECIATNTHSLEELHKLIPDFPTVKTINNWRWKHPEFRQKFDLAKEMQAQLLAEQIIEISDNSDLEINRAKLMVESRKFIAGKLASKLYGAKITHSLPGITHDNWATEFNQALKDGVSNETTKTEHDAD